GHHVLGYRDEGDRNHGCQVANRRHAEARGLQGGIQLAVLDQFDRLGIRHELHATHVLVGQAGGLEDRAGVELGTGFRRADGDTLALQIFQGLDPGFLAGNDVNVVRVGRRDGAQTLEGCLEAGIFDAVPGIGHRVAQGEGQLATTRLQQVEVFYRCLGGLNGALGTFDLVVLLRQGYADQVVNAAGTASEDVDEGRRRDGYSAGCEGWGGSEQAKAFGQSHGCLRFIVIGGAVTINDRPAERQAYDEKERRR